RTVILRQKLRSSDVTVCEKGLASQQSFYRPTSLQTKNTTSGGTRFFLTVVECVANCLRKLGFRKSSSPSSTCSPSESSILGHTTSCGPGLKNDDRQLPSTEGWDGREVVITEKMDGEGTTFYHNGLHARSMEFEPHPS